MTDKELLELAAKAAGINGMWFAHTAPDSPMFFHQPDKSVYGVWNPLTDDGDALRLAVKLRIAVTYPEDESCVRVWFDGMGTEPLHVAFGDDPCAATRRAIVFAAAEIGKAMP